MRSFAAKLDLTNNTSQCWSFKSWSIFLSVAFSFSAMAQASRNNPTVEELLSARRPEEALLLSWARAPRSRAAKDLRARAEALDRLGLFYLAAHERFKMLQSGTGSASDAESLGRFLLVVDRLDPLGFWTRQNQLAPDAGAGPAIRSAVARYHAKNGNLAQAQRWADDAGSLAQIADAHARFRAVLSKGSILYARGDIAGAARVWNTSVPSGSGYDVSLLQLQRARALYELGQLDSALQVASSIGRGSPSWFPAVLVQAWSAYRLGDFNYTLGQLLSLHSPYLAGRFQPESHVLASNALFRLCHFSSAKRALSRARSQLRGFRSAAIRFDSDWGNRFAGVDALLSFSRDRSFVPRGWTGSGFPLVADAVLQAAGLEQVDASLQQIRRERLILQRLQKRVTRRDAAWAELWAAYQKELRDAGTESYRSGVARVRSRLNVLIQDAREMNEAVLAVDLEINTRLRERLIRNEVPLAKEVDVEAESKRGFDFWPFEGEFWRDEVGGYAYATTDVCSRGGL